MGWKVSAILLTLILVRYRSRKPKQAFVQVLGADIEQSLVRIGDQKLRFQLTLPPDAIEPLFSGAAWAGTVVWPASVFLANFVREHRLCNDKVVIELGAGIGVPGIAAGLAGARKAILTEQPPLSDLLNVNINRLFGSDHSYQVFTLDWTKPIPKSVGKVDVILISDCIYEGLYGESWRALAMVINNLLVDKDAFALNCVERRKEDGIDKFITHSREEYHVDSKLVSEIKVDNKTIQLYQMYRMTSAQGS